MTGKVLTPAEVAELVRAIIAEIPTVDPDGISEGDDSPVDLNPCVDCGACPKETRCECDQIGIRQQRRATVVAQAMIESGATITRLRGLIEGMPHERGCEAQYYPLINGKSWLRERPVLMPTLCNCVKSQVDL